MKIYEVGGVVRDALLNKAAKDRDWVVVGSSPEEMIAKGFKPIGKDFPVFLHPETNEEYALARTEKKSGHGYHGFNFYFGKEVTLEEDLSRRDLTINAMAKDADGSIIDPFGGRKDVDNKIFRHVSDAFSEDPLRAIRLARFHTYEHLSDFKITEETKKLLNEIVQSGEIGKLSPNRIWTETERALSSAYPNIYFKILLEYDLQKPYLEDLQSYICNSSNDIQVRWAELQINNNFLLGKNLPIPNSFLNAANTLQLLCNIKPASNENHLLKALQGVNFERNSTLINSLVELPHLKSTKTLILKLLQGMKEADFSVLAEVPKEQIEEEKFKLLIKVIKNCL
ncbi:MAG: tRNA nucleotidyltransferase (CCA-adding enzyme) [Gammaproteobacteria bacterium]|jgi:tRNA nucleotidyltransferase (CCA-adding enzyme)|tara:strand:+ start:43 stop:1062 length:1020 start_codon:yes stop_codon:yes gene_type:complete